MHRAAAALAGLVTLAALGLAAPASAAPVCGADAYESDQLGGGALVPVGGTVARAICQDSSTGPDYDWFVFDAAGGKAYSAAVVTAGSALSFGQLNGLEIAGVFRLNADGTQTTVQAPEATSYERFTTPVLPAGRYGFVAVDRDEVTDPQTFYSVTKPVEGSAGAYTVRLTEAAPAPSVTGLTVPTLKPRTRSGGTYTLSGPAPAGGMHLYMGATGGYVSVPKVLVPAGATRGTYVIDLGNIARGTRVTVTADSRVGSPVTVATTVK